MRILSYRVRKTAVEYRFSVFQYVDSRDFATRMVAVARPPNSCVLLVSARNDKNHVNGPV
jgi:hypothetical protein